MYRLIPLFVSLSFALSAATLEKLSLDDMITKSTDIVRGRVTGASSAFRGTADRSGIIYTAYTVTVVERLKGAPSASAVSVSVPGGVAQGFRQAFPGAPSLKLGDEYVFFLWTSRSGLTQIIGLTQGLFTLTSDASGKTNISRGAASEPMLDPATGRPIADSGTTMGYADLKQRVSTVLSAGKVQ